MGYIDTLNTRTGIITIPEYHLATDSRTQFIKVDPATGRETWYEKYDEYTVMVEWVHIFRYAETLLNLSESYFNVGNYQKAAALLDQVRRRSIPVGDILDVTSLQAVCFTYPLADILSILTTTAFIVPELLKLRKKEREADALTGSGLAHA